MDRAGDSPDAPAVDSPPSRNPEVPNGFSNELLNSDNIGGTAYSKQWLLSTLLKLTKFQGDAEPGPADEGEAAGDRAANVNLSDTFQDELCQLWDMSMDSEVATLLKEYDAVNIFTGVIVNSKSPRATEIAIGILGNLACHPAIGEQMAACEDLVHMSLLLLDSPDPPTLVEASRFLSTVLSCSATKSTWLAAIEDSSDSLCDSITFILNSSRKDDLLQNVARVVDTLFDLSPSTIHKWAEVGLDHQDGHSSFLLALLEAMRQIGCKTPRKLYIFLHILQLLTCDDAGARAIVNMPEPVTRELLRFLEVSRDEADWRLSEPALASVLSVFSTIVSGCGLPQQDEAIIPLRHAAGALEYIQPWTAVQTRLGRGDNATGPPASLISSGLASVAATTSLTAANPESVLESLAAATASGTADADTREDGEPPPECDSTSPDVNSPTGGDTEQAGEREDADGGQPEEEGDCDVGTPHRPSTVLQEAARSFIIDVIEVAGPRVVQMSADQQAARSAAICDAGLTSVASMDALDANSTAALEATPAASVLRFLSYACRIGTLRNLSSMLPTPTRQVLLEAARLLGMHSFYSKLQQGADETA